MKILLSSFWQPAVSGVWTYIRFLRDGLKQRGHQVDVLTRHGMCYFIMGKEEERLRKEDLFGTIRLNLTKWTEPVAGHHLDAPFDLHEMKILDMEMERYGFELAAAYFGIHDYDLIHCQEIVSARALARIKSPHTPIVVTLHGCLYNELLLRGAFSDPSHSLEYARAQEMLGVLSSDCSIIPSHWLKNFMSDKVGLPDERMFVIPYGMDVTTFEEKMQQQDPLPKPTGKKVLLCPARLDKEKGHAYLIAALAKLKQERSDWVCWLAGEGWEQVALEQQVERCGLQSDVRFLGNRDDVPSLMRTSDLVVLPSLTENQPYAVMEAQIAGKAILSTRTGGIPEMIEHGRTGLLATAGDTDSLYQQLRWALEHEEACRKMGQQACTFGKAYWSTNRMLDETLQLYHQVRQGFCRRGGGT